MTAKEQRKYNLIIEIGVSDPTDATLGEKFSQLASVDFGTAVDMWEYMMTLHVDRLADGFASKKMEEEIFSILSKQSDVKLKSALGESAPLLKLIYGNSATSASAGNLAYLTSLIIASKIEKADEILKHVASNKTGVMDYGDRMKIIIDDVFNTYCAKAGVTVPSLNRKQTMLLLEYALKIKGPNKNLLVQRVKELQ